MNQVPQTARTGQPDLTLDHQNVTPRTPSLILTNRYVDAVTFVGTLHATQVRKGSDIPYISHLLGVSALIIEARGDVDQAIAGLLHDTAEDCGGAPVLLPTSSTTPEPSGGTFTSRAPGSWIGSTGRT